MHVRLWLSSCFNKVSLISHEGHPTMIFKCKSFLPTSKPVVIGSRVEGGAAKDWQGTEPQTQYFTQFLLCVSKYSSPASSHLYAISLSVVLVTLGQPRSEHIKWKIPEMSNSSGLIACYSEQHDKNLTPPLPGHESSLCSASPCCMHCPPISHLVVSVIKSTVLVSQCFCSSLPYFI